jgi:hypothetical protein
MTIRRAIFWGVFLATMPAVAFLSFDLVHIQEEFETYSTGKIPLTWWREEQPVAELDWRYQGDENWKSLRTIIGPEDDIYAFRSPERPIGGYDLLEGLMLVRQGRVVGHAILSSDRRRITNLILPKVAFLKQPPVPSPAAPSKKPATK